MTKFVDLFPLKEVAIENLDDLGDVDVSTITPVADQLVGYNGTVWDNSFAIGTGVGDLIRLEDIGGGTPGLPAVDGSNLTGVNSNLTRYFYTATEGQTVFTGSDDNSNVLSLSNNHILFLNGIALEETNDYTHNSTSVTLTNGIAAGSKIMIINFEVT